MWWTNYRVILYLEWNTFVVGELIGGVDIFESHEKLFLLCHIQQF